MENNGTTNGSNGKKVSALGAIQKRWQDAGGQVPKGAALEKIKKELREAYKAEDAAVEALEKARRHREEVSIRAMEACGTKQPLDLGGEIGVVTPTARNERVFYKRMNQADVI